MPSLVAAMALAALSLWGCEGMKCPGSPAWVHASMELTAVAEANCEAVKEEMLARVDGQFARWHDPHNNGTYTLISSNHHVLTFSRLTGNKQYTDKMVFTLTDENDKCKIEGCSESQSTSVADFSTNYCNLRMLYCQSDEGCKSVKVDFVTTETKVSPSVGAGNHMSDCLKVKSDIINL